MTVNVKPKPGMPAISLILGMVLAIGLVGWYFLALPDEQTSRKTMQEPTSASQLSTTKPVSQPSTGEGRLVISEWQVKAQLPLSLNDKVAYALGEVTLDSDNNHIQTAKILIAKSALSAHNCLTTISNVGESVETGAQYIRSELAKPFDASRYRFNFKQNVLTDTSYGYHLNYIVPDCLGGGSNATLIEELHSALINLSQQ